MHPSPASADRFRAGKRLWSAADDALLRRVYPHALTAELARLLRRSIRSLYARATQFGLAKSAIYLASPAAGRLRRGDAAGAPFRFTPGQVPANKGLRRPGYGPGRMKDTQFKPGTPSWRYMPVGSTRLVGGYRYRKVSAVPNVAYTVNWKPEHVLMWSKAVGPVPAGHAIVFRDGDKTNIRLENLACISRRALMARNSVHTLPQPLAQAVQLLGALTRQIRRRSRGEEQDQRPA